MTEITAKQACARAALKAIGRVNLEAWRAAARRSYDLPAHAFQANVLSRRGLARRIENSPLLWEITREGESALGAHNPPTMAGVE